MDPITIGAAIVVFVSVYTARAIRRYRNGKKWKNEEAEEFLKGLKKQEEELERLQLQKERSYMPETSDLRLIDDCKSLLRQAFPNGIDAKFENLNIEEREHFMKQFANQIAHVMQVEVRNIQFCELSETLNGYYDYLNKEIRINEVILLTDPEKVIGTIFHELKHGIQYESVFEEDKWGYSPQLKAQWLNCMGENYINGIGSYLAYAMQAIEVDARMFSRTIMGYTNN